MKKEGNKNEVVFDRDLSENTKKFKIKKKPKATTGGTSGKDGSVKKEVLEKVGNEGNGSRRGKKEGEVNGDVKGSNSSSNNNGNDNKGGSDETKVNSQIQLEGSQKTKKKKVKNTSNNDNNNNNNSNDNINNENNKEQNQGLTNELQKEGEIKNTENINNNSNNNNNNSNGNNNNSNSNNGNINNNNNNNVIEPPIEQLPKEPPYSQPIIINPETPINGQTISQKLNLKIKQKPKYKLTFIYRRKDYTITLPSTSKISDFRNAISSEIHMLPEDIDISLNNKTYNDFESNELLLSSILTQTQSCPIFEVKKKTLFISKSNVSLLFPKNYPNKVIINNSPTSSELKIEIEKFFKDCLIEPNYQLDLTGTDKYSVGFTVPDTAFDFNRYLLILKSQNPKYKNIKTSMYFAKRISQRSISNVSISNAKADKYKSALYVGLSGPYVSNEERIRKEYVENKKKWVSKKGFIPYAKTKNSDMCNKYLY